MVIYASTKKEFIKRVEEDSLTDVLKSTIWEKMHRETPDGELRSWRNSLGRMGYVLGDASVPDDAGVAVEYNIPMSSKRIDILVSGYDERSIGQVVIVELKQWTELTAVEGMDGLVRTRLDGMEKLTSHPSYQAQSYASLIKDYSAEVQDKGIGVWPCAYLHNYMPSGEDDPLLAVQYHEYLSMAPAFTHADTSKLREFISRYVHKGDKAEVLYRIENGEIRPSKTLQDALTSMLRGNREFTLIDEQKEVYEKLLYLARYAKQHGRKQVFVVKGGPGTGKSVVAINALVALTNDNQLVQYVSKNSAPRNVYVKKLQDGRFRKVFINNLFKGSGCFVEAAENELDTIVVDEAHRLAAKSGMFHNLGENQAKEIIHAAKCAVFFIDEHQRVTMEDVATVDMIKCFAEEAGARYHEDKLVSQFRCNGSDGYLSWLDHILYGDESAVTSLEGANYDFKVVDSPEELELTIRARNTKGVNARIVAGYCWNWLKEGQNNTAVHDIVIGNYGISWNLGNTSTWAIDPDSVREAGCIHTCQGLEFEHVGVIIGPDMFYRDGRIQTDFQKRAKTDKSIFGLKGMLKKQPQEAQRIGDDIIRNTYRTLLTRGSKSCTVYCCDKALADYLRQFVPAQEKPLMPKLEEMFPQLVEHVEESRRYTEYLPVYSLRAACGYFGDGGEQTVKGWMKVPTGLRHYDRDCFIVQASGNSMEPRIHDGDWCIFRRYTGGPRGGKVFICQHHSIFDPDTGGAYTIKAYTSNKTYDEYGNWRHESVVLKPFNPDYAPIEIMAEDAEDFKTIAEWIGVVR